MALKKKKYRRGGIEPDPPRNKHKKRKKKFRLQYYGAEWLWSYPYERTGKYIWKNWGKYRKLPDAIKAGESQSQHGYRKEEPWRVIDMKTEEVLWYKEGIKDE